MTAEDEFAQREEVHGKTHSLNLFADDTMMTLRQILLFVKDNYHIQIGPKSSSNKIMVNDVNERGACGWTPRMHHVERRRRVEREIQYSFF